MFPSQHIEKTCARSKFACMYLVPRSHERTLYTHLYLSLGTNPTNQNAGVPQDTASNLLSVFCFQNSKTSATLRL